MLPPRLGIALAIILLSCSCEIHTAKRAFRDAKGILERFNQNRGKRNQDVWKRPTPQRRLPTSENASHHIDVEGDNFVLDGHRLHIISGSLHYFRVPSAYWRDRLHKLKAAGLNSVSTYVEWSHHEPEERQYRFEGDHDVAEFVKIAAEEGLYVLLRPGPYICAERDLGGFPYWLLSKYPDIELRTTDQDFTEETNIWMNKLFEQLELLLFGNGGPIILVQIENEYGSYGNDMSYQIQQRNMIFKHVSTNAILYTTDASAENHFSKGAIPGTLTTIDFMAQSNDINVESKSCPLRHFMPSGPLMNSEFYTGWLTHWGEDMASIPEEKVVKTLEDMLNYHIHINFYVFFGGTNFGFTAGANHGDSYQPHITSYDYDAPLSEAGDPTAKYYEIRNTLLKYNFGDRNYDLPQPSPKGAYGTITVSPKMSLLSPEGKASLGKKYKDVHAVTLPTFEALKQRGGFVLYETILKQKGGLLEIRQPRDLIFVFVDGLVGEVYARDVRHAPRPVHQCIQSGVGAAPLLQRIGDVCGGAARVDCFHATMRKRATSLVRRLRASSNTVLAMIAARGILGMVMYDNIILYQNWKITGYPLEHLNNTYPMPIGDVQVPALYEGQFTLPEGIPLDTFLNPTGWDKGYIWINGHNLGRYWPTMGPQVTLYVPGVWLNPPPKKNLIQILELNKSPKDLAMKFRDYPILERRGIGHKWVHQ